MLQNVTDPPTSVESSPAIDISRSLATIHQICTTHFDELQKISNTKVSCHEFYCVRVIDAVLDTGKHMFYSFSLLPPDNG